tara:strand:+ start:593 stop:826 length:234 start_codon:yes stop_codon:yes gene_type:complete
MMRPIKLIRKFVNKLGLAWWAKVETQNPKSIYWFGPFLTRRSLKSNVKDFTEDLKKEGAEQISHTFFRGKRKEPLTT